MSISAERIKQDLRKINEFPGSVNGRIKIKSTLDKPVSKIFLELNYPTAPSNHYPQKVQQTTNVEIELLSRYPFQEPTAKITTPIYHPNVYRSGRICFGTKWLPTQGLDLLVERIIKIITFDKTILNAESPANGEALNWYEVAVKKYPEAFPTNRLNATDQPKKKIVWNNINSHSDQKKIIPCPACKGSLRVPMNKTLKVTCPKCIHKFMVPA